MGRIERRIALTGAWQVSSLPNDLLGIYEPLQFEGNVPGSTLNDLIRAGIAVGDVFWRDNAETVQKYENYNWKYTKSFSLESVPQKTVELVFERLDTYCDITLNGTPVAHTENGYIEHRFDVTELLKAGENRLEVVFTSPINDTVGRPVREGAFTQERMYARRIQCTYGWDWTMRFVTTGIYGDCYLAYAVDDMELRDVYIYTKSADDEAAELGLDVELTAESGAGVLSFAILDPSGTPVRRFERFCKEPRFRLSCCISAPALWYPLGYGAQPLYTLEIKHGEQLLYTERFGIRTVQILQLADEEGGAYRQKALAIKESAASRHYDRNEESVGFILKVNGTKILCKGANWVPLSPFETEGLEQKIEHVLQLSARAGVNILRVWGGGYVEKKHFYDTCSRLGILVLQDFFMACGSYPEKEAWFLAHLRKEAEYTVHFLRNQPCLAWWHGDNENAIGGCDTDTDYRGRDSAYLGLADAVWTLDHHRAFLPSSPYGGKSYASNTVGTTHNTQFLSYMFEYIEQSDCADYKEYFELLNARFVSEEPIFGASSLASLRRIMTEADIFGGDDAMWKYHTKTNPYMDRHLLDYYDMLAAKIFGKAADPTDGLFRMQYIQCELIRLTLERTRREKWFSSGIVYWMLADCWPTAAGWSIIDYYGAPKAAYYAFCRSAKPLIASFVKDGEGRAALYVTHDGTALGDICCRVSILADGQIRKTTEYKLAAIGVDRANQTHLLGKLALAPGEVAVADVTDGIESTRTFYRHGALPLTRADAADYTVSMTDKIVTVTAHTYLQAVSLESATTDTMWSDNDFIMLPGESCTVTALSGTAEGTVVSAYTVK